MSNLNNSLLLGAPAAGSGYSIPRSLRFNSSDSAFLSRLPGSAGNRKTWTWAGWVKISNLGTTRRFFGTDGASDTDLLDCRFETSDKLIIAANTLQWRTSTQVFRDVSSWYHIVIAFDTTLATANNRIIAYVNGSQITAYDTLNNPSQNADTGANRTAIHRIGSGYIASNTFDGYLADIHFIDGQALTPSSFGEFDATTGVWNPKAFSGGSYGTNGFHLPFSDNSAATAAALGKDSAGSNNWTPNNLSVTAGAGNDSLVDTPTNGTASSGGDAGGTVVGNYCTLNPLAITTGAVLSNGNLDLNATPQGGTWYSLPGTIAVSAGSFYWETTVTSGSTTGHIAIGIASADANLSGYHFPGYTAFSYGYINDGVKTNNGSGTSYGATYTNGDVMAISLNMSTGALIFYKNGISQGTAYTVDITKSYLPIMGYAGTAPNKLLTANFGQRPFAYAAPAGFKSLNTANLPTPTILNGSSYFDTKLYTGNGSTQTISGLAFSPDFVWIKSRADAFSHRLQDVVRGVKKELNSDLTTAEYTYTVEQGLTAFNSDGFTLIDGATANGAYNKLNSAFVSWCWDAGTSTVSNTQGSITSSVRANASAGFSVVTYTGNGSSGATVGHGLGVAPEFFFLKSRTNTYDWIVYHKSLGNGEALILNDAAASITAAHFWNNSGPTSTTFTLGNTVGTNASATNFVAYCFAPVAGYSFFGTYSGNGSNDGLFVYTGFRPRWIMVKSYSSGSGSAWEIYDTSRSSYNESNELLRAALYLVEKNDGNSGIDILSNGFKLKADAAGYSNYAGWDYIYMAFAENPFSIARAR